MSINWDEAFKNAHLTSGPGFAGISIQNKNPSLSQGSRNIFKEDYDEIMAGAKKYGYIIVGNETGIVNFINKSKRGELHSTR